MSSLLKDVDPGATNYKVREAANELIHPFLAYNLAESVELSTSVDSGTVENAYQRVASILATVLRVKAISVLDSRCDEGVVGEKIGIGVFIDRSLKETIYNPEGIKAGWSNGFWTLSNPSSLMVTIVVPRSYVRNLMINIQSTTRDDFTNPEKNVGISLFPSFCADRVYNDLVLAFFNAIYQERYRLRTIAQIVGFSNVLERVSDFVPMNNYEGRMEYIKLKKKELSGIIGSVFGTPDQQDMKDDAITSNVKSFQYNGTVNPYDYYDLFVNVPKEEAELVAKKIPSLERYVDESERLFRSFSFDSSFKNIKAYMSDKNKEYVNCFLLDLQYSRIIPIILHSVYVFSGGVNHDRVQRAMFEVKRYTTATYSATQKFIKADSEYFQNVLYPLLSHPLKNSKETREAAFDVIEFDDFDNTGLA
jgi:hypothetical protein